MPLARHLADRGLGGGGIEVGAARVERGEGLVELVVERDAGRDVETGDVRVGDPVEVLDERAQRVACLLYTSDAADE